MLVANAGNETFTLASVHVSFRRLYRLKYILIRMRKISIQTAVSHIVCPGYDTTTSVSILTG
jgi:hypothetical protein